MFAVQAIEAWILAGEQELNKYLGVTNKIKHENDPESIKNPKQKIKNYFEKYLDRIYTTQDLLDLLPTINLSALLRCKHFKEFYDCVRSIAEAPH